MGRLKKLRSLIPPTCFVIQPVHLISAGVDVTVIPSWLGHANLDTTNHYAQASLETKRRALESFWGPAAIRTMVHSSPATASKREPCFESMPGPDRNAFTIAFGWVDNAVRQRVSRHALGLRMVERGEDYSCAGISERLRIQPKLALCPPASLGQTQAQQQFLVARIRSQRVHPRLRFYPSQLGRTLVVGFVQPFERPIFVSQPGVHKCELPGLTALRLDNSVISASSREASCLLPKPA
jgi:hypothetical protein